MLRAIDVADFFIEVLKDETTKTTNMKLNKLVYFAQGYSLIKYGRPLFNESIEAWEHGPVVQSVYSTFKEFGEKPVNSSDRELPKLSDEERELLMNVALTYGSLSGTQLRNLSHKKGGAWDSTYVKDELHTVIPVSKIKKEFMLRKPLYESRLNFSNENFAGNYDNEGYTVIPKDWD